MEYGLVPCTKLKVMVNLSLATTDNSGLYPACPANHGDGVVKPPPRPSALFQ